MVEVELDEDMYEVDENVGDSNLALFVCLQSSGNLTFERAVTVSVTTEPGTALGDYMSVLISVLKKMRTMSAALTIISTLV